VTTYAIDPDRGTLSPLQTLTSLPEDHEGRNSTSQIHMTSNGRFLYTSNRGHDSIASYAIDEESGLLTATGWKSVGKRPRAFGIDPSGRFLFATSQDAGTMMGLAIDQESGQLTEIEEVEVGTAPMWVSFAELP
jgi:6-phosphogluconolactonase